MNIKAIIGTGVVIVGLVMGAVYLLSQPSSKGSLYQEDEFVSVTSVEEVKPEITVKTPEQIQPAEAIKQDTADQSNEAVEPAITSDASQVEIEAPSEVIEPVIVERDPAEATERGFTVTVYPHETNAIDNVFLAMLPPSSLKNIDERDRLINEKLASFNYKNVALGTFNTRTLLSTDENGRLPIGILAPPLGKYVATGYLKIEEDGFYFIYPIENYKWTKDNIEKNRGSNIFRDTGSVNSVVANPGNNGSQISLQIGNNTVFTSIYPSRDGIFDQLYLTEGYYPFNATFTNIDFGGFNSDTYRFPFPGVNIMIQKVEDDSDFRFIHRNKRRANIYTFPLEDQQLLEAKVSDPVAVKYQNRANDVKTSEPRSFSKSHTSFHYEDPAHNLTFYFTPKSPGTYVFGREIKPRNGRPLYTGRETKTGNGRPLYTKSYQSGRYSCHFGFRVDDEVINEYRFFTSPSLSHETTYDTGGKVFFVDVTSDKVGIPIEIEMEYQCALGVQVNEDYTFTPLLKTPGNNSFLPLEAFAE